MTKAFTKRVCGLDPPFSITTDLQCTYIDLILVLHPLLAGAVNRLVASVSVDSVISCVLPGQRRNKSVLIYNPILATNYMYNNNNKIVTMYVYDDYSHNLQRQ